MVVVHWPGCIRGAIMAALTFLLNFLRQGKKWKRLKPVRNTRYQEDEHSH